MQITNKVLCFSILARCVTSYGLTRPQRVNVHAIIHYISQAVWHCLPYGMNTATKWGKHQCKYMLSWWKSMRTVTGWRQDIDTNSAILAGVGVTIPISSVPLFSKLFRIILTLVTYWITLLRFTCVLTSVRYQSDSKNPIGIFTKSEIYIKEKSMNGAVANPAPGNLCGKSTCNRGILSTIGQ